MHFSASCAAAPGKSSGIWVPHAQGSLEFLFEVWNSYDLNIKEYCDDCDGELVPKRWIVGPSKVRRISPATQDGRRLSNQSKELEALIHIIIFFLVRVNFHFNFRATHTLKKWKQFRNTSSKKQVSTVFLAVLPVPSPYSYLPLHVWSQFSENLSVHLPIYVSVCACVCVWLASMLCNLHHSICLTDPFVFVRFSLPYSF